jgi:hypothetical protein
MTVAQKYNEISSLRIYVSYKKNVRKYKKH